MYEVINTHAPGFFELETWIASYLPSLNPSDDITEQSIQQAISADYPDVVSDLNYDLQQPVIAFKLRNSSGTYDPQRYMEAFLVFHGAYLPTGIAWAMSLCARGAPFGCYTTNFSSSMSLDDIETLFVSSKSVDFMTACLNPGDLDITSASSKGAISLPYGFVLSDVYDGHLPKVSSSSGGLFATDLVVTMEDLVFLNINRVGGKYTTRVYGKAQVNVSIKRVDGQLITYDDLMISLWSGGTLYINKFAGTGVTATSEVMGHLEDANGILRPARLETGLTNSGYLFGDSTLALLMLNFANDPPNPSSRAPAVNLPIKQYSFDYDVVLAYGTSHDGAGF